ncbi:MAG: protein kinase domain-containing protein [Myxococcota bacterium]
MKRPMLFGKYCLLERISVGGMAEVFRAKPFHSPEPHRFLALKRILPHLAEDDEFIKMFVDEARLTVQLDHPNIVRTYELGQFQSSSYILMEFISGKDVLALQKALRRNRRIMNVAQACFLGREVSRGMDYVHNKHDAQGNPLNIIHRDISPQNILITYSGRVKLIDFGIAKAAVQSTKTQVGVLKGKFGYMSPQQVRGEPIDHRSDIYSIGIVLWEILTNRRLFRGDNEYETLQLVREPEIEPPSSYVTHVPAEVDEIVMKALSVDPGERYQHAGDLARDLDAFLEREAVTYGPQQLASWMAQTFPDDLEEEKEKREIFREINTPEDVRELAQTEDTQPEDAEDATRLWDADVSVDESIDVEEYASQHTVVKAGGFDAELFASQQEDDVIALGIDDLIEVDDDDATPAPGIPREKAEAVAEDETKALSRSGVEHMIAAQEAKQEFRQAQERERAQKKTRWLQVAAAMLAMLMVSGLGVATYHLVTREKAPPPEPKQAQPTGPGTLVINVSPPNNLEILLDGQSRGSSTPLTITGVEPGRHDLEVRHESLDTHIQSIEIEPEQLNTVDIELQGELKPEAEAAADQERNEPDAADAPDDDGT